MTSHLLLIKALELAEANVLQPFNYLILVWAMLMGWVFYGEVLDAFAISGAALVTASGLYIGLREARYVEKGCACHTGEPCRHNG